VQTGAMSEVDLAALERCLQAEHRRLRRTVQPPTRWRWSRRPWPDRANSAMVPGVYAERLCDRAARGRDRDGDRKARGPLPRELVTRRSLENASAIVAATAARPMRRCIFAIANEAGIRFTVDDVAAVFAARR